MPSNANAICCQRNPNTFLSQQALFFLFSQIPFFSFCLHLLNFPATIHFGYWPNEYQLTMYTSQERWQIGKNNQAGLSGRLHIFWWSYLLFFLWRVRSLHRKVRIGDLQHMSIGYVITDTFLWYKMGKLENKSRVDCWGFFFLFLLLPRTATSSNSINQLSTCIWRFYFVHYMSFYMLCYSVIKLCSNFMFPSNRILNISHIILDRQLIPINTFWHLLVLGGEREEG